MTHFLKNSKLLHKGIVYKFRQEDIYEDEVVFVFESKNAIADLLIFSSQIEKYHELSFIHPNPYGDSDILVPLTYYFTKEQLESYKKDTLLGKSSLTSHAPDYGLYKATDEDIIRFLKGEGSLWTYECDQDLSKVSYEDEIYYLTQLVEENEVYVIKPF